MIDQNLQQTVFHIEKLKNIVNVGRSTAYHIYTSAGPALGHLGDVMIPAALDPANDEIYNPVATNESNRTGCGYWIRKAIAAFRAKS